MNRLRPLSLVVMSLSLLAITVVVCQAQEAPAALETALEPMPESTTETGERRQKTVSLSLVALDEESEPFLETLEAALIDEFKAAGFLLRKAPEHEPRWKVTATCLSDRKRLVWKIIVSDTRDGAMTAALSGAAFAGISALPQLQESAAALARSAAARIDRLIATEPIAYALRFESPDEGATLRLGNEDGVVFGAFSDGELTAPYEPFEAGRSLVSNRFKTRLLEPLPIIYARCCRHSDRPGRAHDEGALWPGYKGTPMGRLAGINTEYRYFMARDALFGRLGLQAWSTVAGSPKQLPILHEELRLGFGSYVFLPRDSRLRLAVGSGVFGTISAIHIPDLARRGLLATSAWTLPGSA
ncbi:hypothetical protein MASR2M48_33470 [Spirochaetota bacterium]